MLRSDNEVLGQGNLYFSVTVGGLAFYICYVAAYQCFPHPWIAKLSGFYMASHAVGGRNTFVRHDLHRRFGSVVRVGPNELSFYDLSSIKEIYGQSSQPYLKAPYSYRGFTITGTESVFNTTDRLSTLECEDPWPLAFRNKECFNSKLKLTASLLGL